MRIYEVLQKKRDGQELSAQEIKFLIDGVVSGDVPDYQVAAWLMAVYFRGMSQEETSALTAAMAASGDILDLSDIPGVKVDKHSTGGVGDKTTLVLAPMVAAAGVPVAKMSGRALGHTGGTIDKLESFPGLQVALPREQFVAQVKRIGLAIAGQTANLAPADKLLYALRDVTATVDSIPLIAASVMSKKLASGADAFVLDVKTGSGAFMQKADQARELARIMVDIAARHGKRAAAIITDMSQPLGQAVGNILEVREAIAALRNEGPPDLTELCLVLGAQMLVLAGRTANIDQARQLLQKTLASGQALEKLAQMVEAQGGDPTPVYNSDLLPQAAVRRAVTLQSSGYVQSINALEIGLTAMHLGAGRQSKLDNIDLTVGVELTRKVGDYTNAGDCVAVVHANTTGQAAEAARRVAHAFTLNEAPVAIHPLVIDSISS